MLAAAAIVLVPLLGVLIATGRPDQPTAVAAPPACDGSADPAPGATELARMADLDGDGCSEPVLHDPDTATLTLPDGDTFTLGAPGDVLLLGDWDGDGRWTPGLHRPSTDQVFLFDRLAVEEALTSGVALPVDAGTAQVVDTDGDGRHEVQVGRSVAVQHTAAAAASTCYGVLSSRWIACISAQPTLV